MGSMFKCDITGKAHEGHGLKKVLVDLENGLRLEVVPVLENAAGNFLQAEVGPEAAEVISKALQGAIDKVQKGK